MALIPKYHTTVVQFPVDPADVALINSTGDGVVTNQSPAVGIYAGMCVGINSSGFVKKANATTVLPLGLSGDTLSATAGRTAYASSLVVNSAGSRKSSQNRVSDYFNETLGSGLLSVYVGGGEFFTDMYDIGSIPTLGAAVYASVAVPGFLAISNASSAKIIGVCTSAASGYPSGVPGVGTGADADYSMPLTAYNAAGNFVGILLSIQL